MRPFTAPELTYLANRKGYVARILIWVKARNRITNAVEELGLWDGPGDRVFTLDGVPRTYYRAGSVIDMPPILYQTGLDPRIQRMSLSPLSPVIAQLLRGYDTRGRPVEIRRAMYSTDTNELIAEPRVVWKGTIDQAPITTPEVGGTGSADVSMKGSAQDLTKVGYAKKSDANQRLRSGDRFFRYAAVSGEVAVKWGTGEEKVQGQSRASRRVLRRIGRERGGDN